MAVLPILRWPDPALSTPCPPVAEIDDTLRELIRDMLDTMYDAPGRGLAAPQVGVLTRLFVMDVTWKDGTPTPRVMINPRILWQSEEAGRGEEGCLSIPGVTACVKRPLEARFGWTDPDGVAREETLTGFEARCAQHELDHLDGRVTLDRIGPRARARLQQELAL